MIALRAQLGLHTLVRVAPTYRGIPRTTVHRTSPNVAHTAAVALARESAKGLVRLA